MHEYALSCVMKARINEWSSFIFKSDAQSSLVWCLLHSFELSATFQPARSAVPLARHWRLMAGLDISGRQSGRIIESVGTV